MLAVQARETYENRPMIRHELLNEFEQIQPQLIEQASFLERRLHALLTLNQLKIHSISARVKKKESLKYKISRPEKTYRTLSDVTDLIGLRIITYFEETIEAVARLIETEFQVDFINSVDRLKASDETKFGYRSFHSICHMEGSQYRFEIQIRTVLQHAWAEIEHDLGYKGSDLVPTQIRRRFSRVASLLEIADEEFVSIRRDLLQYENRVRSELTEDSPPLSLDRISFNSVVSWPEVSSLDLEIAHALGKSLSQDVFFPDYLLKMLKFSGLSSIGLIRNSLRENREQILEMVTPYFEFTHQTWKLTSSHLECVHRGYSLFFLSHVAVLKSKMLELNKVGKVAQFYRELDYPEDERLAYQVASGLIKELRRAGHGAVLDES